MTRILPFLEVRMGNDYYLGRKLGCRHKRKRLPYTLFILLLSLLAVSLFIHDTLFSSLYLLCENASSNRLENIANQAAYTALADNDCSYTDYIRLSYGADGTVVAATVDTVRLNLLKTELALSVLRALKTENISLSVPIGNLTGLFLLSGKGEELEIDLRLSEGLRTRFYTRFTEAGINQTRHAIGFTLDFTAVYLIASRQRSFSVSVEIPVGETLIVGKVPDSLTQINRFSEEVTDLEIDDAVDFGNVLS